MKIIHSINNHQIERDIDDKENINFLLTNGLGGYAAFGKENNSRYNGWFVSLEQKMFKIIDEIKFSNELKITGIQNDFYKVKRFYEKGFSASVFFPQEHNSLIYELSKKRTVEIILDVRESYDARNFGKNYEVWEEDKLTIIKYSKYKNWEEDKSESKEYEIFIAINTNGGKIEKTGKWLEKHYGYDKKRASRPFDKHVYNALKINAKKIIFSVAFNKESAKTEAIFVSKNVSEFESYENRRLAEFISEIKIDDVDKITSCVAAKNSMSSLIVRNSKRFGVLAGFPWFFQFWTSDEAICLKSASQIDKEFAKKILLRDIKYINADGKTYDILDAKDSGQYTLNMDAAGWLFLRAAAMIKDRVLDKEEIKKKIILVIENLRKNYLKDGLAHSEAGETWMDTFYAGDFRDGARIEIQALMLSMYKTAFDITLDEKYKIWEYELRENVRKNFWNGKILADGLGDWIIRPNIFIAYYVYPELLSSAEWKTCFKEALTHLWLNWGGVATIDKTSPLFYAEHTGETSESYHRGDSWYWINNLAALALYRVDKNIFRDYVDKILEASSRELLWQGTIGHMSELSSAKEQISEGAWSQAWSVAIYLEAMEEIVKPYEFTKVNFESGFRKEILKPLVFETKKSEKIPHPVGAEYQSHHKNLLKIYEILLVIILIFTISVALGTVAYAVVL